jgi:hypothetical protein
VPGFFAELGLKSIGVHISDKAVPMFPPYESKEQQVNLKQALEWEEKDFLIWNKVDSKKYYTAGGGSERDFDQIWNKVTGDNRAFKQALSDGQYHTSGGCLMYLVSGFKA